MELNDLLDEVCNKYRIDASRIYMTGLSMGGYGTWSMATQYPQRLAGIAPVCGGSDVNDALQLKGLPVWAFHGEKDNVVPFDRSLRMVEALWKTEIDVKFTTYPDAMHDSWTETYANPKLYEWMLSCRKQ